MIYHGGHIEIDTAGLVLQQRFPSPEWYLANKITYFSNKLFYGVTREAYVCANKTQLFSLFLFFSVGILHDVNGR